MKIQELTIDEVVNCNRKAIADKNRRDPNSAESHNLIRRSDLESAIRGVFYQSINGYENLPIEKMAGLLLYKVSQRQAFENGNKRTAFLAVNVFLWKHGLQLRCRTDEVVSLLHGFATQTDGSPPTKTEIDAVQFIFDNVMPKLG